MLEKGVGRAFAPGHITGFFEIHDHGDPRQKGSTGCGLVLDCGIETTVTLDERTDITLDAEVVEAETTRAVIDMLTDIPVRVESRSSIPVGCGFGASGAGGLSTGYALNQALSLGLSANQITEIAHVAEVKNSSGLGDVAAQSNGGIVIRTKPGAPAYGSIDWIPSGNFNVHCIVLGELSTREVLNDPGAVKKINSAGREALKQLLRRPTVENFMELSRDFAYDTELVSSGARDVIEAVESAGGMASQAMLGDTVFAIGENEMDICSILSEFGKILTYRVNLCRPALL